jgi:hypothetical protein
MAFHANDVATVSDQYLVSPAVVLPTGQSPVTLQFWNYQELEDSTTGCFDGAVVEISTNGGSTWTRLESELLTDPYDGVISSSFSNPLAGQNAWCGDPQAYLNSIVDINAFAGQTAQFRFRLATDSSVSHPGWDVDDVVVQSCLAGPPGFDIDFTKTVGTDPSACATSDTLNLPYGGGEVTYCYEVTNTGTVTLTEHDLVDSELGTLLNGFAYSLTPGSSVWITASALITQTTVNLATWTAGDGVDTISRDSSATVNIAPPEPMIAVNPTAVTSAQAPDNQVD